MGIRGISAAAANNRPADKAPHGGRGRFGWAVCHQGEEGVGGPPTDLAHLRPGR